MSQQCCCDTCHTPHHNHIHLFPATSTASVVMVCVLGLDKVECTMVTDDGEVSAIHKVTQLMWCANTMAMHSITPMVCLCCGMASTMVMWWMKYLACLVSGVATAHQPHPLCLHQCAHRMATLAVPTPPLVTDGLFDHVEKPSLVVHLM